MKKAFTICLALLGLFALQFATQARADTTFVCTYLGDNATISYTVTGATAPDSFVSTWVFAANSKIDTADGFARRADTLVAPGDTVDSLLIEAKNEGPGAGKVWLFFSSTEGAKIDSCQLCFTINESQNITQIPCYSGPTMTEWGLVVFAGLFIAVLIFVIRKRARVPAPA